MQEYTTEQNTDHACGCIQPWSAGDTPTAGAGISPSTVLGTCSTHMSAPSELSSFTDNDEVQALSQCILSGGHAKRQVDQHARV